MLESLRRAFSRKASATTRLQVEAVRGAEAVWTPREFDKLIEEGYEHAVWVYACVGWLTRLARNVRWVVRVGEDEPDQHPYLRLMNRPNAETSGAGFIESLYGFYLTSGNTYIERVGLENRAPEELWVKRPDRMRVLPDPETLVRGYAYKVGQDEFKFDRWQVRHLKTWAPLNDWYGMSPIAAAARGVDVFNAGMSHNLALMQNGARPTGAWVTNGSLTDQQFARLRSELQEAGTMSRRGRPMLLEGGTSWQELGLSPRDLDFLAGQEAAGRQIHAAYGVHPVVTGLSEGTFENQRQALRSIMLNAVLPFLDYVVGELNEWLSPLYGPNVTLTYDRDSFPAISEDQESLWRRADIGWGKGFLTRNEVREMVGFDRIDGDAGDIFVSDMYQPPPGFAMSASPVEVTKAAAHDVAVGAGAEAGNPGTPVRVTRDDAVTHADMPGGMTQLDYWRARTGLQDKWAARFRSQIQKVFSEERAALASAFDRAGEHADADALVQTTVNPERWDALFPWWLAVMTAGGDDSLRKLPASTRARRARRTKTGNADLDLLAETFGVATEEALERAAQHVARLKGDLTITTRSLLRDVILEGMREGLSMPRIARRIDDLYLERIIPKRSTVIARTETIRATNFGSQEAAKGTGLTLQKRWLSTMDDRTREPPDSPFDHVSANGQTQALDDPYIVSGERLMFPGDPVGSPGNTIQCRCTEYYVEVGGPFEDPGEGEAFVYDPSEWPPEPIEDSGGNAEPEAPSLVDRYADWDPYMEYAAIEANREASDAFGSWSTMSRSKEDERAVYAMRDYTEVGYDLVNHWLRYGTTEPEYGGSLGDPEEAQSVVEALDHAFTMPEARLPVDQLLHRGKSLPAHMVPADLAAMVGTELVDAAFLSTSASVEQATEHVSRSSRDRGREPAFISIKAPAGQPAVPVASFSSYEDEEEVVLPRGLRLRIVRVEESGGTDDIDFPHLRILAEIVDG